MSDYQAKLQEKAEELYAILISDPYKVPLLEPRNEYPEKINGEAAMKFWTGLVERMQIKCDGQS